MRARVVNAQRSMWPLHKLNTAKALAASRHTSFALNAVMQLHMRAIFTNVCRWSLPRLQAWYAIIIYYWQSRSLQFDFMGSLVLCRRLEKKLPRIKYKTISMWRLKVFLFFIARNWEPFLIPYQRHFHLSKRHTNTIHFVRCARKKFPPFFLACTEQHSKCELRMRFFFYSPWYFQWVMAAAWCCISTFYHSFRQFSYPYHSVVLFLSGIACYDFHGQNEIVAGYYDALAHSRVLSRPHIYFDKSYKCTYNCMGTLELNAKSMSVK